jgi:ABC-type Mn2+/Zn2+ transport system ATPase subunit
VATATVSLDGVAVDRGRRRVLDVGSLSLRPGVTALVGPNGSGKSTLLHAVAGLIEPARGSVSVAGGVSYVLQATAVSATLPVTVRETVSLARAASLGPFRPLRSADRAAVTNAMRRLDVDSLANRHLAELSGGQRQRVFVAQGIAQGADVLLLDEPVAGLDLPSAERIREVVADERAAGRTVVIATHDLDEAARADHAVLLAGRVVADGHPDAVLTADNLRVAYGGHLLDLGDGIVALDDGAHGHHGPGRHAGR